MSATAEQVNETQTESATPSGEGTQTAVPEGAASQSVSDADGDVAKPNQQTEGTTDWRKTDKPTIEGANQNRMEEIESRIGDNDARLEQIDELEKYDNTLDEMDVMGLEDEAYNLLVFPQYRTAVDDVYSDQNENVRNEEVVALFIGKSIKFNKRITLDPDAVFSDESEDLNIEIRNIISLIVYGEESAEYERERERIERDFEASLNGRTGSKESNSGRESGSGQENGEISLNNGEPSAEQVNETQTESATPSGEGTQTAVPEGAASQSVSDADGDKHADVKPVGIGEFGPIYNQFVGKANDAVRFLIDKKEGEAIGALHHKDVGDIDLVWGKEGTAKSDGFGLSKLAKYHPEVLDKIQDILDEMVVTKRSENRVQMENGKYQAAVRLTWDNKKKTWLLTMFEKKSSAINNTTDTANTYEGNGNDTATPGNAAFPYAKVKEKPSNIQENTVNNQQQMIAEAESQVNISPTDAQKEAGNYKKGHVAIDGYNISIEQPKGSIRKGTDRNGKQWEHQMNNT